MSRITDEHLKAAEAAVAHAQDVRKLHRRRTPRGAANRETDLRIAQERLQAAMRPLRSYLCGFQYGPQTQTLLEQREQVEAASRAIQGERRRLWKMQKR